MHIPDGYLSPQTAVTMYAAAAPFWYLAARKAKVVLTARTVPLLSIFAAFAFAIQMFNIPLPGGTTGHAIGATLMAVVLGPWLAIIGMSITLVIQALIFGDGGITAIGANVFNIAVVPAFVGYFTFRLISGSSSTDSRRWVIGGAVGSYLSINAGALLTAFELGLQPLLFHQVDGTPLYAPYGLAQAIPVMMLGHLTVAGFVEALVTGMVIAYLQRANQQLLALHHKRQEA